MKRIIVLILLLIPYFNYAQFAIIKDTDGYVNVREKANAKAKIVGKIKDNDIVYLNPDEFSVSNWLYVFYENNAQDQITGYIHSSRLKLVSGFKKIEYQKSADNTVFFKNDIEKIEVEIAIQTFNSTKNSTKFSKKDGFYYAYKNKPIWGTDGGLPNSSYKFIKVKIKGKDLEVPQELLENLFQPTIIEQANDFKYIEINYDKKKDVLYISSLNSDGAGSYVVLFIFEKSTFKELKTIIPF